MQWSNESVLIQWDCEFSYCFANTPLGMGISSTTEHWDWARSVPTFLVYAAFPSPPCENFVDILTMWKLTLCADHVAPFSCV